MTYQHQKSILPDGLTYILIALAISPSTYATELFRWQDDKGNTHYTDHVPPQYIKQGYRVISEQGLTIRTIKSISDIEKARAENTLALPKKLSIEDQRLLITYSNEDEIISTRARKLASTETILKSTEKNIDLLDAQFRQLAKKAGDYEKQAKPIPSSLLAQISGVKRKIANHNARLKQGTNNMTKIAHEFDEKLLRYRQLKNDTHNLDKSP